ncbi:MAG: BamA/TamA family outer membrane protein [Chitinophagaceae bacterium]|nr:BamA/TamA family outer membrane protein [Chitinophagaceae bacterium]
MRLDLFTMSRLRCFTGLFFLLLLSLLGSAQQKYTLQYFFVGKDTTFLPQSLGLQNGFNSQQACRQYVEEIPKYLQPKGYIGASVDSVQYDSLSASVWLYIGQLYKWEGFDTDSVDNKMLYAIGWNDKMIRREGVDFAKLEYWQNRMLNYYENNGYPFAKIGLDSLTIDNDKIYTRLIVHKGPAYKIDSIRVYGKAKISNYFLQRYLGIENGSPYKKEKLNSVSRRLLELPYLRETKEWDITMTGTGSVLNLYIDPKKSSQADVLVGFLPATNEPGRTKLQLTGEANINLKNALGSGETIGVNWQQIQVKSPRLHLLYEQPYLFNTPFGIDFNFDLLKKDSSFLNLNAQFGIQYLTSGRQNGKVFIQTLFTNVLPGGIDTASVKSSKKLPSYIDVNTTNLGLNYRFNNTDYRFNPRKGSDLNITVSAGIRKIRPNTAITHLKKDAAGNDFDYASLYDTIDLRTYVLRGSLAGAHYVRTGKQSVFKMAFNSGWLFTPNVFRNEMFQVGGYKLLRGFDEESIYTDRYGVLTAEYRFFIGLNSYFFGFADAALAGNKSYGELNAKTHNYIGVGLGMAFETRAGIFNLSYAVGKRDDIPLNFRQAKIHFGLVSLF